jgi:lipase (class 3)
VASFRGTENISNFFDDTLFVLSDASLLCSGCQAFYGFWGAWMEGRSAVMDAVKNAYASNPSYKIVLVGHSLEAAVATLAMADFRQAGFTVDMVCPAFHI